MEVVFPFGESMDHSEEFSVENVVVALSGQKSFGKKSIGV